MMKKKITIIHTNDLHSHLLPATISARGGMASIATLIENTKKNTDHLVLTLDAGDFLMGTLFQVLEIETGFQLHLMQEMGYDAVGIGNHEFDFGIAPLCNYLQKAHSMGCPPVVLSNLKASIWNKPNSIAFKALFAEKVIEPFHIIDKQGIKIGIIGLLGNSAFESAPNANELHHKNRICTAKRLVRKLRKRVDFIVCLSHSGIKKDEQDQWKGEDIELAQKVNGLDLIVSAHTHTQLLEPIVINNTPIVQASCFGQFVGIIELEQGNSCFNTYQLVPITPDIPAQPKIQQQLEQQMHLVKQKIEKITGFDNNKVYFTSSFPLLKGIGKMGHKYNLSQFVADAIYYYINKNTDMGCDVSFIANGMIREQMNAGKHYLEEMFQVACLGISKDPTPGYPLAIIYITPFALKRALEVLIIQKGQLHAQFCGIKIDVDYDKMVMNKIEQVYLKNKQGVYEKLNTARSNHKLISVAADYYVLSFIPMIKKRTFGLINIIPRDAKGKKIKNMKESIINFSKEDGAFVDGKIWKALLEFGQSFPDTDGDGIPNVPNTYAPTHDPQAVLS